MDVMLGFLGEFISAAELVGKPPVTLTINKVTLEKVESLKATDDEGGGKLKDKVVVYFKESKSGRGWLLNRTNAEALKAMWGRETDNWLGHKVTLFVQQVRVGKKMEPGIRVKGSPELDKPLQFELKLPRKKPILTQLVPTPSNGRPLSKPEQQPEQPAATLDECLALLDKGDREAALDLARGLTDENERARFDLEYEHSGEAQV